MFHHNMFSILFFFLSAPLVDSIPRHSSSAMLMLLSVVILGLAIFLIYKFKRYDNMHVAMLKCNCYS